MTTVIMMKNNNNTPKYGRTRQPFRLFGTRLCPASTQQQHQQDNSCSNGGGCCFGGVVQRRQQQQQANYSLRSVVNLIGSSVSCGHHTADAHRTIPTTATTEQPQQQSQNQ
mmetsp:Transcript_20369/g.26265  ORF Transcript_20369/g.26265 Transcript_20369/m.26265 type:complete len:111 (+) Transcript_20369:91-423(+)